MQESRWGRGQWLLCRHLHENAASPAQSSDAPEPQPNALPAAELNKAAASNNNNFYNNNKAQSVPRAVLPSVTKKNEKNVAASNVENSRKQGC